MQLDHQSGAFQPQIEKIQPTRNAIIIEYLPSGKRIIHIECKDETLLPSLRAEAGRLVRS
jgi:hypothetical protein